MHHVRESVKCLALLLSFAALCVAQSRLPESQLTESSLSRYALVLSEVPLAHRFASRMELRGAAAAGPRQSIHSQHQALRALLQERHIATTGAIDTIGNAVFVKATPGQESALRSLPGVIALIPMRPVKRNLNAALDLMSVPAAWNAIGGSQNAGAGIKIAILDTGIDQKHPGFQDSSLKPPSGFPKCQQANGDCAFTNNKVIVARSYVSKLNFEFGQNPTDTRPDDFSPRDRVGHGTAAAMVAAGVRNTGPLATITGVAPKAFLGNYKIFGSPGVNDTTFEDVVLQALNDAVNDGMDIAALSLGAPALWGATDSGTTCGLASSQACDWRASAVENAAHMGLAVVVSSGNDGDLGSKIPLNSIQSPGTAPSAITVGASLNSHAFYQTVSVNGSGVPAAIQQINTLFGNGPKLTGKLTAPVKDVASTGDNGEACSPLAAGSLTGSIALILRGDCQKDTKVNNAQNAGAIAVIMYQGTGANSVFPMLGLENTGIPAVLIGNNDGVALKQYIAANPNAKVTLDPSLVELKTQNADTVASFSSQGPTIETALIKPELVAVGTDIYTATQTYDPNGDMYDPSGYTNTQGTSFAAPLVAGAAALIKQQHPSFNVAQIKSALVNTANDQVNDYDVNGNVVKARATAVGAGKLDAAQAIKADVTVEPATLSFGIITSSLPSQTLTIRNGGAAAVNLTLAVQPRDPENNAKVVLANNTVTVSPGQSTQITVRLTGSTPQPGSYEGVISIQGGAASLHVPYLYQVGNGTPFSIQPLEGFDFVRNTGGALTLGFKVIDQFGVPVSNVPVQFKSTLGGGTIDTANPTTDTLGIAEAKTFAGKQPGEQEFTATAGGLTAYFDGRARPVPAINSGGVVNTASFQAGQGLAPGSYVSIYGTGLAESTRVANTPYLPISLAGVSVSFDGAGKSLPGHIHFVSSGQVDVQIPWEFQGTSSVSMKVSIGDSSSQVYSVPLNDYSPAAFEYTDSASGKLIAAALDEKNVPVTSGNPVARGHVVQLYVNGLGPVDNPQASGEAAPAQPLANTRVVPVVTIAGAPAHVSFSGLAPFNVGLYQLNVVVPADSPVGIQPVVIVANGVSSKQTNLPIQ
jgi:minor extracellular serine protease Vpr